MRASPLLCLGYIGTQFCGANLSTCNHATLHALIEVLHNLRPALAHQMGAGLYINPIL